MVNGVPHTVQVPARRLLADLPAPRPGADRHPPGLRARRLRGLHGAGRRAADALLPAVRRRDGRGRDHHRGGLPGPRRRPRPGAAGVPGLPRAQCGFCTPGFVTTVTAWLAEHPDPTEEQAREAIGNLCRYHGYQNIVASVLRAAEIPPARRDPRDDPDDGEPIARLEDRGWSPGTAATWTTWARGRWRRRSCAAPTPPPGWWTSTSAGPWRSTGWSRSTPTRTWRGRWPSRCPC